MLTHRARIKALNIWDFYSYFKSHRKLHFLTLFFHILIMQKIILTKHISLSEKKPGLKTVSSLYLWQYQYWYIKRTVYTGNFPKPPKTPFIIQAMCLLHNVVQSWWGLFRCFQTVRSFENHPVPFLGFTDGEMKAQRDKINLSKVIEE